MVYSVTPEGVEGLRTLSTNLRKRTEMILKTADQMTRVVSIKEKSLGPHAASIIEVTENIRSVVNNTGDSVDGITGEIDELVVAYQDIIDNNLFEQMFDDDDQGNRNPPQKVYKKR